MVTFVKYSSEGLSGEFLPVFEITSLGASYRRQYLEDKLSDFKEEIVDKDKLLHFKNKLLRLKTSILNGGILTSTEDLHTSSDDLPDETDLATNIISQQVSFHIRDRELEKLRLIDMALERIDDGSYGICED